MPEQPNLPGLEIEIDTRLASTYAWLGDEPYSFEQVAKAMRFAYGQGYTDAHKEKRRGETVRPYGFKINHLT